MLQVWFGNSQDFQRGLQDIIKAGGDTDTTGAIYGGIVGASVGKSGIPASWLSNIVEWPRTIGWIERLASATATAVTECGSPSTVKCPRYFVPGIVLRNLFFLMIVLAHGFRRLAPPW